ncbi:ribonuclease H-like domain-containing protein [Scheffersomyces coipomensis]|uniref:ribonuclease H-like domain-containing protein n=1 Tax=Scheffersomyces coipomensis TaxID=1788519 RepID=UPI00315C4D80
MSNIVRHYALGVRIVDREISSTWTVYIDGACPGNGTRSARAGYGVYYEHSANLNSSMPLDLVDDLTVNRPTNQRAELFALRHALREAEFYFDYGIKYLIMTDSMYIKNCMDVWVHKWIQNDWTNSKGFDVANKELIQETYQLYKDICVKYRRKGWQPMEICHVPGHSGNIGNEKADALARQASDRCGVY